MLTKDHTVLPATHTFIHEWNEPSRFYTQPSRRASPHFGRYSFPVPQKVAGWVGLGSWLHTDMACPDACPKMVTHSSSNRPCGSRTVLPSLSLMLRGECMQSEVQWSCSLSIPAIDKVSP